MDRISVSGLLNDNINSGVIHGGVVLAGTPDGVLVSEAAGMTDGIRRIPMGMDTVIDIASVTKAAALVTALLRLHFLQKIDFDAPFTDYLPEYQPRLQHRISVRDLANHTSGFHEVPGESQRRYFNESGRIMMQNILRLPPPFPPTETEYYSCWNYLLLTLIAEKISGMRLDEFCRQEIFLPLEMHDSSLGRPVPAAPERLARTMGTAAPGQISDQVAFRIYRDGKCAGNAGMFSTAQDLARLLTCYLRHGRINAEKYLFGEAEFAQTAPDLMKHYDGYRRFGWVIAEPLVDRSWTGTSLWHSGWSGQTVFMNFRRKFFIIVLTARCGDYDIARQTRFKIINQLCGRFQELLPAAF